MKLTFKTRIKKACEWLKYKVINIKSNIRAFMEGISRWFSYFSVCVKVRDFDYSSVLYIEYQQLSRVRDHINKNCEGSRNITELNIALNLLDIILEGGSAKLHGKGLSFIPMDGHDKLYEIMSDPDGYYTIPFYVNANNAHRFLSYGSKFYTDPKDGPLFKDYLRQEKAWHLYHKIRSNYLRSWWD